MSFSNIVFTKSSDITFFSIIYKYFFFYNFLLTTFFIIF
jgi:hypothetical protein